MKWQHARHVTLSWRQVVGGATQWMAPIQNNADYLIQNNIATVVPAQTIVFLLSCYGVVSAQCTVQ